MKEFKKCKGQGRAIGFDGCSKPVKANLRKYGLCPSCFKEWAITTPEGDEYLKSVVIPKAKKKVDQEKKIKEREEKEKLVDYESKLQDVVNSIARLIDNGLACLAQNYHPRQMHGGHIFSRGSSRSMRYNLHNIHRQSAQSNWKQSDDVNLRKGLIGEYGENYFEFLNTCRQTPPLKLAPHEWKKVYKTACEIEREIRREGRRYTALERMLKRSEVNLRLGLYETRFCVYPEEEFV